MRPRTTSQDSVVSSVKRHAILAARLLISLGVGLIFVLIALYVVEQVQRSINNFREIQLLKGQIERIQMDIEVTKSDFSQRLDGLERTIYGDVLSKVEKAAAAGAAGAAAAPWQKNRDEELRRRIIQLERWRLRVEHEK